MWATVKQLKSFKFSNGMTKKWNLAFGYLSVSIKNTIHLLFSKFNFLKEVQTFNYAQKLIFKY